MTRLVLNQELRTDWERVQNLRVKVAVDIALVEEAEMKLVKLDV